MTYGRSAVFFKDFRINVINFRWILNLEFRNVLILEQQIDKISTNTSV
jgi:hypothetical protein